VNGKVNGSSEELLFDFFDEDTFAADHRELGLLVSIAFCSDSQDLDL